MILFLLSPPPFIYPLLPFFFVLIFSKDLIHWMIWTKEKKKKECLFLSLWLLHITLAPRHMWFDQTTPLAFYFSLFLLAVKMKVDHVFACLWYMQDNKVQLFLYFCTSWFLFKTFDWCGPFNRRWPGQVGLHVMILFGSQENEDREKGICLSDFFRS